MFALNESRTISNEEQSRVCYCLRKGASRRACRDPLLSGRCFITLTIVIFMKKENASYELYKIKRSISIRGNEILIRLYRRIDKVVVLIQIKAG